MVLLFLLPLALSLLLLLPGLFDFEGFSALLAHPQFWGAVRVTVFTGLLSTALALTLAIAIVMEAGRKVLAQSTAFMALPHLALALGVGFLVAPTGILARLLIGGAEPPTWPLVHDPLGIGLIAVLVLKETPFLVWALASQLQDDELRLRFQQEMRVARSLGHGPRSAFLKIILPQLLSRNVWPLVAVFSYGMTVVDMALVIGPTQPPSLAQLLWVDLNDGETQTNARGAAGTLHLSAMVGVLTLLVWAFIKVMHPVLRRILTLPPHHESKAIVSGRSLWMLWFVVYAAVILALLIQSVSLHWPYPQLLANGYSFKAWGQIMQQSSPLVTSLMLGCGTACLALVAVVAWFETQSVRQDRWALLATTIMLCVPALLVSLGLYRLLLQVGWTGTWMGLFMAHLLPVTAYVFVMLQGPYRAYDRRWQIVSSGLGVSPIRFLTEVKWPMLKGAIFSSLAIGFAVSVAQYVPAQLAAAGRFSTLPMEAVTLSSGGNRALISAYALALMLLPLWGFAVSATVSKSRWHDA